MRRLVKYIFIILNLIFVTLAYSLQLNKLDPCLRAEISIQKSRILQKTTVQFPVIIHGKALNTLDYPFRTCLPSLITAKLSLPQIEDLSEDSNVHYIEQAQKSSVLLDVSAIDFNILPVWQGDLGSAFQGENVIVGIYDTGIDFKHPDFIDDEGKSRILYLWDQTDPQSSNLSTFNYGIEYTQSEINDEIDGTPTGNVRQIDLHGHGTHVAGIAAGNGSGLGDGGPVYQGMAPKADLIVVKGGDGVFDNSQIIDGMNYIFQKASSLDRPIVVNLSLGSQEGPHDGTSAIEKAINNFLWDPSRAVVVSAGNSGNEQIHTAVDLSEEQSEVSVHFQIPNNSVNTYDFINFDIWYSGTQNIDFSIRTSSGELIGPVATGSQAVWPEADRRMVVIDNAFGGASALNGDNHLWVQIADLRGDLTDEFPQGEWELLFNGDSGTIHCWIYETSETIDAEFTEEDAVQTHLVASPGNSNFAITVGAYVTRTRFPSLNAEKSTNIKADISDLADFSSPGPTRTGGAKPEMTAPGQKIVAPFSSDASSWPGDDQVTSDSLYRSWQGTSMAAPHVTGLVALMFEADPTQNSSDIKTKLIQSCRTDNFTGDAWNALWGYGKVDALAAMQHYTTVQNNNVISAPRKIKLQNYPNPFNGSTQIAFQLSDAKIFNIPLKIFNLQGQEVFSSDIPVTSEHVDYRWHAMDQSGKKLSAGIYVYQINIQNVIYSQKMLYLP